MIAQPKTNADQVHNLAEGAGYQLRYVIKHVPELAKIAVDPLAIFNWNYIGGQEPTSTETYYDPDNVPHTVTTYQGQVFNTGAENIYIYRHYNANAQSVNKRPIYTIQAGRIMNCALAIGDVIIPQSVMYAINISNCTLSNEAIPRDRALQSVVITDIHTNYYINLSNKNDIIAITDEYINRLDAEFQRLSGGLHLENYVPTSRTINGYPLTNNITLTASDIEGIPASQDLTGYVQNTRTINGKNLKQNITLTYSDLNLDSRYLKLTGGTLTGQLISTYSGNVPISLNKIGVGTDTYRDIQALRATTDGSTKRVGTIRFQANTETNDLILGVSNGSNSAPSGISISRNLETGVTTVTAPTPASGDNSTKIATTAWVNANTISKKHKGGLELYPASVTDNTNNAYGGYIDFHYNKETSDTTDYTARIIESDAGTIKVIGNLNVTGTLSSTGNIGSSTSVIQAKTQATTDNSNNVATTAYVKSLIPNSVGDVNTPVYVNSSGVITSTGKSFANYVPITRKVNGKALSSDITLDIPTKVSQLTNDSGYLKTITSNQITTALGYTPLSSSASVASATKASQDGNGNNIVNTYATKTEVSNTYAKKTDVANTYITKTDVATTYSTKTNTIKGLSISGKTLTYTKGDGTTGTLTLQDNDTIFNPESVENWGTLKGYSKTGTATTINDTSTESNVVNSSVTVSNGSSGRAWTKIAYLKSACTVTLGNKWKWANNDTPTIVAGGILVCNWCSEGGIAYFVSPQ